MIRPGQQNGFILMPVVLAIVLIATLAFLLNNQSAINIDITTAEAGDRQADYVAAAGLSHAIWSAQNNSCGGDMSLTAVPFGPGGVNSYTATVDAAATTTNPYSFNPDQDTTILESSPAVTGGSDTELKVKEKTTPGQVRSLLHYDLSTIPAGARVTSATAWFYVTLNNNVSSVYIHPVTAGWIEATATWNSIASSFDSSVYGTISPQSTSGVWVSVNLAALVQSWVNDASTNHGIMLIGVPDAVSTQFSSSEYSTTGLRPYLQVTTAVGDVSPLTITATGTLTGNPSPANDITRTLTRSNVPAYQPASETFLQLQSGSGKDAELSGFYNSRNFGGDTRLRVSSASGSPRNSLVQFDMPAIPAGAKITSAQLQLYHTVTVTAGADAGASVHRVSRDWVEGTKSGSGTADGATWDTWDGNNNWTTAGGDYSAATEASSSITTAMGDWESWDIKTLVQGWIDGDYPNNGLLLKGSGTVDVSFASKEDADPTRHPKLTITYACECGATCQPPQGLGNVLMAVINPTTLVPADAMKKALFESWGYTVNVISESANQTEIDTAVSNNDVVYVSNTVNTNQLGVRLAGVPIGVINEDGDYNADFGTSSSSSYSVGKDMDVIDTSHYITALFATGMLPIYSANMENLLASGTLATDLQVLGSDFYGAPGLAVVGTGGLLADGSSTAAGRRVMLPIGRNGSFNWDYLNNNGRLIVQRALQWGTGNTGAGPTGPTAHWKLDETTGTIAADSVGGHDGTLVGNPTWSTGAHGGALDFDGVGDRVDVGPILDAGAPQISIVAWVFKRDTGDDRVISKSSGGAIVDHIFSLGVAATTIRARLRTTDNGGTSDYDGGTISLNKWVHLAFTYDGGMLRIYMDGTETASYAITGDMIASTLDVAIGNVNATDDRYWNGLLDDVRIYDYMLTGTEIADLAVRPATTPLAHWKLDETSGVIAVDSVGGHDGTLNNSSVWSAGQIDGALNFNGSSDYINVPHADTLSLTNTMTFIAWVNASSYGGSYQSIIAKDASGTGSNYYFGTWQQELVFGFFSGGVFREVFTSGLNLQAGTWYQLAASFDNATDEVVLYVDGAQVHSGTLAYNPTAVTADLSIGRSPDGEYWPGLLDDVRLYDSVLPASEIADLYTVGRGGGGGIPPPASVVYEEFTDAALGINGSSLTISKPAGTATGDLLIAAVATDGNNTSSLVPPAGWNVVHVADSAGKVTFGVWWKIASAIESSSYTFSWSNSERAYGWIMRFNGSDPSSPVNVISNDAGASAAPPSPSVVTTVANTLILRLGGFDNNQVTPGLPGLSGHTVINMNFSDGGNFSASGGSAYVLQPVAGDSGTSSFTLTKSEEYVTVTIAITPAP